MSADHAQEAFDSKEAAAPAVVPMRANGRAGPVQLPNQRPAPMTPADCDLTDFKFMPLLVGRLRDSDLASEQTPEENWAAVLLWGASWHQVPAASLPDVDATIAKWAGYMMRGKVDARWKDVRQGAMRGFVLCSDGRWYHAVVAEVAREAWTGKLKQRLKTECNRIKKHNERHGTRIPFPDFDAWLAAGCPVGHALPVPGDTGGLSPATPPPCHLENGSKGQGEGQGEGQGQGFNTSEASPLHPAAAPPAAGQLPGIDPKPDPGIPDCPHAALVALYAKHLPQLVQPRLWEGARVEAMRARWRQCAKPTAFGKGYRTADEGIAFWDRFFAFVATCPALRDGIQRTATERRWFPDLPWLMKAENFAKVIEGKYT